MNGFGWINANDVQQKELKHLLSTSILLGHLLLWPWRLSGKWGVGVLIAPQIQLHSSLAGNLNFHRPPVKCPASDFGLGTGLIQPASYPWPSRCHACLVATPPPHHPPPWHPVTQGVLLATSPVDVPSHCYRGYYKILEGQFMALRWTNCFWGHLAYKLRSRNTKLLTLNWMFFF